VTNITHLKKKNDGTVNYFTTSCNKGNLWRYL